MSDRKRLTSFAALLIILAFLSSIICVITGSYIQVGYEITTDSVSPKRFYAPVEIENKVASEKLRQQARESVVTLYKHDPKIKKANLDSVVSLFSLMSEMRAAANPIAVPGMASTPPAVNPDKSKLNIPITDSQFNYLMNCESAEFESFYKKVYEVLSDTLDAGVKDEGIGKSLLSVKEDFMLTGWTVEKVNLGHDICKALITPNLVVDEEATQKAKEEKAQAVKPIMYRPNQKIIDKDEIITEEIYAALQDLGYINNGFAEKIWPIIGAALIVILVFFITLFYITQFYSELLYSMKEMMLLFTLYCLFILATRLMYNVPYYFIPLILVVLLISVLMNTRLAIITSIGMTMVGFLIYYGDIKFLIFFIINGIAAAILGRYASERNKIFRVAIIMSVINAITVCAVALIFDRTFSQAVLDGIMYSILGGLLSVLLTLGSLPLWEAVFGIVTPIKLLDLTSPNNKLLRRLAIEAPGTYQHSLIVANLAETAAYDIGANEIIARAGAYFHDVGKLKAPQYFAENQVGENPHDFMEPQKSVEILRDHITHGLVLAAELKLPMQIRSIIEEHHGSTLIKYFYHDEKSKNPDKEVDSWDFRYHNRKPQSVESAVVMLADTVEAAVRSIIPTCKSIDEVENFIKLLIKDKLDDGQLDESNITVKDLNTVAKSFLRVFKAMYHERVAYPIGTTKELESDEAGGK